MLLLWVLCWCNRAITVTSSITSYHLKALYQHIVETVTFSDGFCIFLGQENGNVRIRAPRIVVLWRWDHATYPCLMWPAGVALCPQSGKRASEIDIVRIASGAEVSVCFFFRYLVFIFVLSCHLRCIRLNRTTAMGVVDAMRPAILPALAHAWRHVVRLISNVSESNDTRPLYPYTVPLR